jgi:hypothetical protein
MTELQTGTVTRYCKPSTLDEQRNPNALAFQRREGEKYLSVYLLDYFKKPTESEKVTEVKWAMEKAGFSLKASGKFATLDIEESKNYIVELISETISYKGLNLPHCGVFHEYDDLVISELLSQCIKRCYPGG